MELFQNSNSVASKTLFDDVKMFEFIFKAYFPRLRAFAGKFIEDRSVAEDIIQDVSLKVWLNRKTIEEETLQSYLFTMVRNACINHIKRKRISEKYNVNVQKPSTTNKGYNSVNRIISIINCKLLV